MGSAVRRVASWMAAGATSTSPPHNSQRAPESRKACAASETLPRPLLQFVHCDSEEGSTL